MRLTKRKAINITIEEWEWLAKTGKRKLEWPGWEKYGQMESGCPLCEYGKQRNPSTYSACMYCPYHQKFGYCLDSYFQDWVTATTIEGRKKYATLFLEQLRKL